MGPLIDAIERNFQRLLRWAYPGFLFLVLMYGANSKFLVDVSNKMGMWGVIVGGLVAGAVVYLFQAYVVSWVVTFAFIFLKWDVRQGLQVDCWPNVPVGTVPLCCRRVLDCFKREVGWEFKWALQSMVRCFKLMVDTTPVCCLIPFARVFDRMASATVRRWQHLGPKGLENYLNYAWAAYHAVLITGWLTIVFFYWIPKGPETVFTDSMKWKVVTPAALLLFGGMVYYAFLTRIRWGD